MNEKIYYSAEDIAKMLGVSMGKAYKILREMNKDYNIVMSHIRNIREKIEDNPSKPIYIQTVWGLSVQ